MIHCKLPANLSLTLSGNALATLNSTLLQSYVPGVYAGDENQSSTYHLEVQDQPQSMFQHNNNHFKLTGPFQGQFPLDAYHLLHRITRKGLLQQGYCVAHGACIGSTLVLGHSGSGKTSVLLKMLQSSPQPIVSGNTTVLSTSNEQLKAIAGTRAITLNSEDIETLKIPITEVTSYGKRTAFMLPDEYYANEALVIDNIALIQLNDGAEHNQHLSNLSALHTLYPFMTDAVNADIILGDNIGFFDGSIPTQTKQNIAQGLKTALEVTPVHRIVGSMEFVTEQLNELNQSPSR